MDFPVIYNTTQLIQWLVAEKIPYEILGFTAMGDPVVMAHKDGEGRPVLVTAGAHAVEPAGVSAALMLLKNWDKPYPLYVIPLRDPLGSQGYAPILAKALGHKVEFHCHEELSRILLDNATEVFVNSDAFVLVKIGETLFVSTRYVEEEAGPRQSEIFVDQFLQEHPEVLPALAGRRIVCPANFGEESETVGLYERAFTAEISNYGVFVDMNRRFGCADAAIEVKITQQVCDQLHPQLVIDMHEGFGSSYYFFFADYDTSPKLRKLAALMDARMSDYGEPTAPFHHYQRHSFRRVAIQGTLAGHHCRQGRQPPSRPGVAALHRRARRWIQHLCVSVLPGVHSGIRRQDDDGP